MEIWTQVALIACCIIILALLALQWLTLAVMSQDIKQMLALGQRAQMTGAELADRAWEILHEEPPPPPRRGASHPSETVVKAE